VTFTRFSDSASMKYHRAQYHYRCLKLAYERLRDSNLRLGPQKRQIKPGEGAAFEPRIQPNERWGLIIGDCVQNLRAALDHAAFQLVPEPPKSEQAVRIAFPIFDDEPKYQEWKAKHTKWITAVDPRAVAIIDALQPCRGADPHGHILWKLYSLSNLDKHRSIHLAFVGIREIASKEGFVVQKLEPETGTVVIGSPPPDSGSDIHLQITVEVAFASGDDIAQQPVFPMLVQIGATVAGTLNRLRRYMV